jgi:6,7-dimethyl-8-ribityllumazine synthase
MNDSSQFAPEIIEGHMDAAGACFAIVAARFNAFIVESLVAAALDTLRRHGVKASDVTLVRVPGAWEAPPIVKQLAKSGRFDAVIALGCVIRGATPHFDYVAGEAARGLSAVARETGVPVVFGVLTTENIEQALERAGTKAGNKGHDAAVTAIEMVSLKRALAAKGI